MMFSRILLALTGAVFAGYGLYCAADLDVVVRSTSLVFGAPAAEVEARAMYGGLQTGLGLLLLYAAARPERAAHGLLVMVFVLASLALGRLLGIVLDGSDPYNRAAIAFEATSALLAAFALRRERRAGSAAA